MSGRRRTSATLVSCPVTCLVTCLVLAVAGCTDDPVAAPDPEPSTSPPSASVPELQPGAPGEDTTTRDPDSPLPAEQASEHDVAFMQMMVLHHRQALQMAELVPDRGADEQVRTAASRIEAAQAPEILLMSQWLTDHSIDVPAPNADPADYDHAQHGHAGMEGMLSPSELEDLADAEGPAFDRLFLEGMIRHHQGAVSMSGSVLTGAGTDPRVAELATDIVAEQTAEIGRLQRLLDGL